MPPSKAVRDAALARPAAAGARRAAAAPPHLRLVLIALVVVALLGGGWLWLRQSSLVAVRHVTVTGASGPQAARIAAALEAAARDMTTLDVRSAELRRAVEPFPIVAGVSADASPPHRLRIVVHERLPVAVLVVAGARVGVAADGTILRGHPRRPGPRRGPGPAHRGPAARRPRAPGRRAPWPRRPRACGPAWPGSSSARRAGSRRCAMAPLLVFGDAARAAAKWAAAVVRPGRPALGRGDLRRPRASPSAPPPAASSRRPLQTQPSTSG